MPGPQRAGRFDIADIVRAHRAAVDSAHTMSPEQKRVLTDIANCRTPVLGGHVDVCTTCGYERPSYNSCRNRHCPKCQALAQETWIEARRARMLDVKHFHVVFTLPAELRSLAAFAPCVVYDALFHAASRTLLEFGERNLDATLGATLVLHTWTRELLFHPHVHVIVTGGGLAHDGTRWNAPPHPRFLFPVKALSKVFRGKMMDLLRDACTNGRFARFDDFDDPDGFDRLLRRIAAKNWNVYAKPSFGNGQHVLSYLGRYTHRVGIANSRLLDVTPSSVTFRTKGDRVATLSPTVFLERFVLHVLPTGFHKIRHVGLYASTPQRDVAQNVVATRAFVPSPLTWRERFAKLTGVDLFRCPLCGTILTPVPLPAPLPRAPPPQLAA